jgi:hypothetical protein
MAHMRQDGFVHAHGADRVDVEQVRHLGCVEGLERAGGGDAGIVDDDVDLPAGFEDRGHGRLDGAVVRNVHLDDLERSVVVLSPARESLSSIAVPAAGVAHGGEDVIAVAGERLDDDLAKAAAGPGDQHRDAALI